MFFQTHILVLISISVLTLIVSAAGNVDTDEIIKQKLEDFIPSFMKCRKILGLAMVLVRGNRTVYKSGFGIRDLEKSLPVTTSTLFSVASLTKAFSVTLAADAVSRGLLKWDAPIKDILGEKFKLQDDFRTERVSIRDCFAHRMGIQNFRGVTMAQMNISLEELVMRRLRHFPTFYDLRHTFLYSSYNTILGAYTVERATGEKWEDAIYQRIFKPVGMTQTRISSTLTDVDWENFAYSYTTNLYSGELESNRDREVLGKETETPASLSVKSSADDMAKWIRFHLRAGMTDIGTFLVEGSSLRETYRPSIAIMYPKGDFRPGFPIDDTVTDYGMGWRGGTYRGYRKVLHGGWINGNRCIITLIPEGDVGVWMCLNNDGHDKFNDTRLVSSYALDLLLGLEPWLNHTTACTYPLPWQPLQPLNANAPPPPSNRTVDISQYIGNYVHPAFGRFFIFENPTKNSQLRYKFGIKMHGTVSPASDGSNDNFLITVEPPLTYEDVQPRSHQYPNGYPIWFTRAGGLVHSVYVSYLDKTGRDLPAFIKEVVSEQLTTPILTPAANSAGGPYLIEMATVLIALCVYIF